MQARRRARARLVSAPVETYITGTTRKDELEDTRAETTCLR